MRRAFFLVAWPFWFVVMFVAVALTISTAKMLRLRREVNSAAQPDAARCAPTL
jgi:hypothetical protein